MKFTVTKARFHPLYGIELTDQEGEAYLASTKWSLLEAGVVTLIPTVREECPYRVRYNLGKQPFMPNEEHETNGTDDPVALALVKAYHDGAPGGYQPDWMDVALPASFD